MNNNQLAARGKPVNFIIRNNHGVQQGKTMRVRRHKNGTWSVELQNGNGWTPGALNSAQARSLFTTLLSMRAYIKPQGSPNRSPPKRAKRSPSTSPRRNSPKRRKNNK